MSIFQRIKTKEVVPDPVIYVPTGGFAAAPTEPKQEKPMTNVIPMFAFKDHQLRTIMIAGEPWFVAADALRCLDYKATRNVSALLQALDSDEKGIRLFNTPGGPQRLIVISRPGLFKLTARSTKPEAREFDRWVRHDVLPQIIDTGGYMTRDADPSQVLAAAPENKSRAELPLVKQLMAAVLAAQTYIGELEVEKAD